MHEKSEREREGEWVVKENMRRDGGRQRKGREVLSVSA